MARREPGGRRGSFQLGFVGQLVRNASVITAIAILIALLTGFDAQRRHVELELPIGIAEAEVGDRNHHWRYMLAVNLSCYGR